MIHEIITILQSNGVILEPGLDESEVDDVEFRYRIKFPPDLRALLMERLPVSTRFPDWRHGDEHDLLERIDEPITHLLDNLLGNNFWVPQWGERPLSRLEAVRIARRWLRTYPRMIPVYSHRFISEEPSEGGNPIFSMYGADIMIYGINLHHYFLNEFGHAHDFTAEGAKEIRGWTDVYNAMG